ncbi:cytochrome P450 [Nigerium massiliense]|uniref:cytochrome P450 n=1 Tax=Nigerium massiliense TaxID=1522317 RepID=UPI0006935CC5|nr:cytochrome P450 [Nigerium massiliense]
MTSQRRSTYPGESAEPRVEHDANVWRIRSAEAVRQVLRERDATTQAGFASETVPSRRNDPILFMDGEKHRQQRSKTARFFAPKTVSTRYRELMATRADDLVAEALTEDTFRLDQFSLRYSVEIAAQVIGLTNSPIGPMATRLERFFEYPHGDAADARRGSSRFAKLRALILGNIPMGAFYLFDVRPAIKARRAEPAEDVISHLVAEGYSDSEILIECVTYGAAGMVTTREFISMCTWHLLTDDGLRRRYLDADQHERYLILSEVLRLEPIVGHLFRRAQRDFAFTADGQTHQVRSGELLDLFIRQANSDESTVGAEPLQLRPGRDLPRGIGEEVMSFGDGPHKCPGNALAIQETDVLVRKLMALDLEVVQEPTIGWDALISGYSLRGFVLRARRPAPVARAFVAGRTP